MATRKDRYTVHPAKFYLRDQIWQVMVIEYLTGKGCVQLVSSSRKYLKFSRPEMKEGLFYWVGKKGSVRVGKTSSDSFSVSDKVYSVMKQKGLIG